MQERLRCEECSGLFSYSPPLVSLCLCGKSHLSSYNNSNTLPLSPNEKQNYCC
jgi:hypothetical protein